MTKPYAGKKALVRDHGLFPHVAAMLARDFDVVFYDVPWGCASPDSNELRIGYGFPGVTRVEHGEMPVPPTVGGREMVSIDDVDLLVEADVYHGPRQWREAEIDRERGSSRRIWGAGLAEDLELRREDTKILMQAAGVDIGPYDVVTGCDALREYLQSHRNIFVKNNHRGDFETFLSPTYAKSKTRIDRIERHLGPFAERYRFICEKKIDNAVELAWDTYCVDGEFPSRSLVGLEIKGLGYVGHMVSRRFVPEPIMRLYEAFQPTLREFGYRGMFAVESRMTKDGKAFMLDPSCRFTSPCSEVMGIAYDNLPEIIWEGAGGTLQDPEPPKDSDGNPLLWCAQLMLSTPFFYDEWYRVGVPAEIMPNVKMHRAARIDGAYWVLPADKPGPRSVGAVCAVGRSMKSAIDEVKRIVGEIDADELEYDFKAFDQVDEELDKLAEFGLKM